MTTIEVKSVAAAVAHAAAHRLAELILTAEADAKGETPQKLFELFDPHRWIAGGEVIDVDGDDSGEAAVQKLGDYAASRREEPSAEQLYNKARELGLHRMGAHRFVMQPVWVRACYQVFAPCAYAIAKLPFDLAIGGESGEITHEPPPPVPPRANPGADDALVLKAAIAAHEANRDYCASIGDFSQVPWDQAPDWQKQSAINGVEFAIAHNFPSPEEMHGNWMKVKLADGWKYGPVKNPEIKEHPCLVSSYEQLPEEQRKKDEIFRRNVMAVLHVDDPAAAAEKHPKKKKH